MYTCVCLPRCYQAALQQPYNVPYEVLNRTAKHFTVNIKGHRKKIFYRSS